MALFEGNSRADRFSDPAKLLVVDHEKVERLFDEIEGADTPVQRRSLVSQLDAELTRHTRAEEEVLYPFIRKNVPDGSRLMDEAEHEHAEAKQALADVATYDVSSQDFAGALDKLKKLVTHHVEEEEREVFPKLEEATDGQQLHDLRGQLEAARAQFAPTPTLPSEEVRTTSRTRRGRGGGGSRPTVWVQPHHTDDDRWQVRRDNATRASRVFDTQGQAEGFGRRLARREKTEFVLAGRDGSIREKESYGDDPRSIPG